MVCERRRILLNIKNSSLTFAVIEAFSQFSNVCNTCKSFSLSKHNQKGKEIAFIKEIFREIKNPWIIPTGWSTAWKVSKYEVFLVRVFLYSVRIQENTDQKKLRIWTLFTQWSFCLLSIFFMALICHFWN